MNELNERSFVLKILKNISIFLLLIASVFFVFSCSKDDEKKEVPEGIYTDLLLEGFIDKNGVYTYTVSTNQLSLNLNDYIHISEFASWSISEKEDFSSAIDSNVNLKIGDNIFFIKIDDQNSNSKTYKINIIRSVSVVVEFNTNGGTACASQTLNSGDFVKNIPTTLKSGYEFLGWDYDFSSPITQNITVNAQWKPKEYTITVDMSSVGVANKIIPVVFGEKYSISAERVGYILSGYLLNSKEFSASGIWNIDTSITVVPTWTPEKYTISYVLDNDNVADEFNATTSYTFEDEEYILPILTDEQYEFLGWYKNNSELITSIPKGSVGNIELYARWKIKDPEPVPEPEIFEIRFDAEGTEYHEKTMQVTYGEEYQLPLILAPDGYVFDAWKNGEDRVMMSGIWNIRSNVVLKLQFKTDTYEIEYVLDNDVINPNSGKTEYNIESETYILLEPTKPNNYIFQGWYTNPSLSDEYKITEIIKGNIGDITLYAKFVKETYKINYDANGGTVSSTEQTVEFGEEFSLLKPEKPGYEFVGWLNNGNAFSDDEVWSIRENVELVASYKIIQYKIEYDLDGGEDPYNPTEYNVETDTIILKAPIKLGYNFVGWKREDTDEVNTSTQIIKGSVGDVKFTAIWDMIGKKYSYSEENGVKTATLIKYSPIEGAKNLVVEISDVVYYNGEKYTVTKIAQEAFADLTGIVEKVIIPSTLNEIGDGAFRNCDGMEIIAVLSSDTNVTEWTDALIIGLDNKHVADVIKGIRPKIGWNIYV